MRQYLFYFSISIFSVFIGSQITEAVLLVPYWKSLSATDFYSYYQQFGPSIAQFYTILTIIAALIPVAIAIYCRRFHPSTFSFALISVLFAILFIACFYVYFKGTNALFYKAAFSDAELQKELITWGQWHWGRILLEIASLGFLITALVKVKGK